MIKSAMIKRVCQIVTTVGLLVAVSLPIKAEEILLKRVSGVYHVPLRINDVLTRDFVLDTGAAEVVISEDVLSALVKHGSLHERNYLPHQTFILANGARVTYPRVIIDSITLGNVTVRNVPAVIVRKKGALLLGQSFLSKLGSWSLDNRRQVLTVNQAPSPNTPSTLAEQRRPSTQRSSRAQIVSKQPLIANQQLKEGLTLQQNGEVAASIRAYTQSIRTYPTALAYLSRSGARLSLKDYGGAEVDATQAIRLAPDIARGYNNRALARISLGNYAGAIADASQAIQLNSKDGYAYAHRAVARSRGGDQQGAIRDFQRSANLFLNQGNTKMHRKVLNLMTSLPSPLLKSLLYVR